MEARSFSCWTSNLLLALRVSPDFPSSGDPTPISLALSVSSLTSILFVVFLLWPDGVGLPVVVGVGVGAGGSVVSGAFSGSWEAGA